MHLEAYTQQPMDPSITTQDSVVGIGMPTVDFLYSIPDSFLLVNDITKESVRCFDKEKFEDFLKLFQDTPKLATGGCCSNTIKSLCMLKINASISGRLGSDSHAKFYKEKMEELGANVRSVVTLGDTQQVAVMVTPDHKRSCVAYLGVSSSFCREDVVPDLFSTAKLAYCEGYLLLNKDTDLLGYAMQQAKEAKCLVALNICDTLVVDLHAEKLMELCTTYVDILFANEMEAEALASLEAMEAARFLAGKTKAIVVITKGDQGCYVAHKETLFHSPANSVNVVDTTGAGDLFAAGFLCAFLRGRSLEDCAWAGNLLGGKIVGYVGTDLPCEEWQQVEQEISSQKFL